jgi:hypothetical protein
LEAEQVLGAAQATLLLKERARELAMKPVDGDAPAVSTAGEAARMVWEESKRLWGIGMPIAIATLSLFAVSSVTTIFVGHLGNLPLAAASIGLSVYSTFALGFLVRHCSSPFSTAYICMLTRARLLATERR